MTNRFLKNTGRRKMEFYLEAAEYGLNISTAGNVDVYTVNVRYSGNGPRKRDVQRVVVVTICNAARCQTGFWNILESAIPFGFLLT